MSESPSEPIEIDLPTAVARLRAQPRSGDSLLRRQVLHHGDGVTIVLFLFEPSASLPEHRTKGRVSIHVLEGRLQVTAVGRTHDLFAGRILLLPGGVPHSVLAEQESVMLLNIHSIPG